MKLAYLDPGSGSILLQALLGGLAGLAVAGKLFGGRLLSLFRRSNAPPEQSESHAGPMPDTSTPAQGSDTVPPGD